MTFKNTLYNLSINVILVIGIIWLSTLSASFFDISKSESYNDALEAEEGAFISSSEGPINIKIPTPINVPTIKKETR